jgi:hypothetical protein
MVRGALWALLALDALQLAVALAAVVLGALARASLNRFERGHRVHGRAALPGAAVPAAALRRGDRLWAEAYGDDAYVCRSRATISDLLIAAAR